MKQDFAFRESPTQPRRRHRMTDNGHSHLTAVKFHIETLSLRTLFCILWIGKWFSGISIKIPTIERITVTFVTVELSAQGFRILQFVGKSHVGCCSKRRIRRKWCHFEVEWTSHRGKFRSFIVLTLCLVVRCVLTSFTMPEWRITNFKLSCWMSVKLVMTHAQSKRCYRHRDKKHKSGLNSTFVASKLIVFVTFLPVKLKKWKM